MSSSALIKEAKDQIKANSHTIAEAKKYTAWLQDQVDEVSRLTASVIQKREALVRVSRQQYTKQNYDQLSALEVNSS